MTKILDNGAVSGQEILERIKTVRTRYRFEHTGSFTIHPQYLLKNMAVAGDRIYIAGRKRSGDSTRISIFHSEKGGRDGFSRVVDGVSIGSSLAPLCVHGNESRLIYPSMIDEDLRIVSRDMESQGIQVFDPVPDGHLTYVSSMEIYGSTVLFADVFSHRIMEYDVSGRLIRRIRIPDGYEYPLRAVKTLDGDYLVAFGQDHHRRTSPEYSSCANLQKSYVVKTDGSGRIVADLSGACRDLFERSAVTGLAVDGYGNAYVLISGSIVKIDLSRGKVFEADVRRAGQGTKPGTQLSGTRTIYEMKYFEDRVYLLGIASEPVLHVFRV
jgi:hypothetical protein